MKLKLFLPVGVFFALTVFFSGCAKDKAIPDTTFTDAKLYALVQDSTGAQYYFDAANNSNFTADATGHQGLPYRLRMNAKAKAACTASGKLPSGGTFPDSSLLVKVLRNAGGSIQEYAAMYKLNGTWSWARYKADAVFSQSSTVLFSINGDANTNCLSCHNNPNRDNVWTFDAHP